MDLEFGLPIQVRDTALSIKDNVARENINREYFVRNAEEEVMIPIYAINIIKFSDNVNMFCVKVAISRDNLHSLITYLFSSPFFFFYNLKIIMLS